MTKKHFEHAASMVRAILNGEWTNELPDWSGDASGFVVEIEIAGYGNVDVNRIRAIWTAEAFLILFESYNPRFDRARFLTACGL